MESRLNFCLRVRLCMVGLALVLYLGAGEAMAQSDTVRLTTVNAPVDSGLLDELLPDFEKETGYRVEIYVAAQDVFNRARKGKADLVISHFGFIEVERFVMAGLGLWPRPLFANQSALLGPPDDPARVRGLTDAVEAFRRIAQTKSPFLVNNNATTKYITQVLWEGAGRPEKGDWYIDLGLDGPEAVETADKMGAYTFWGVEPFVKLQEQRHLATQILLLGDPMFQRTLVAVIVDPEKIPGVNVEGARALQRYLISPVVQARIRAFRYARLTQSVWWPQGLNGVIDGLE